MSQITVPLFGNSEKEKKNLAGFCRVGGSALRVVRVRATMRRGRRSVWPAAPREARRQLLGTRRSAAGQTVSPAEPPSSWLLRLEIRRKKKKRNHSRKSRKPGFLAERRGRCRPLTFIHFAVSDDVTRGGHDVLHEPHDLRGDGNGIGKNTLTAKLKSVCLV